MNLIVYSVIITYRDHTQDLDNIFPTKESAILYAQKLTRHNDVIRVEVNKDEVTEEFGRGWLRTVHVWSRGEDEM